jgi:hypothetical protein
MMVTDGGDDNEDSDREYVYSSTTVAIMPVSQGTSRRHSSGCG